jgi:hypothetical protein
VKIKLKTKDKIEKLSKKYFELIEEIYQYKVKHDKVFTKLEEMQVNAEAVKLELSDLARASATPGETVYPFSSEDITIEVQSPRKAPSFDVNLARKLWGKDILRRVLVVDSSAVNQLLKDEEINPKLVKKALIPGEDMTPRVIVKARAF